MTHQDAKPLPPPEWLYDRIMLSIEPELTTAQLPTVQNNYQHESPEEHDKRMERYARAFTIFGDMLQQFGSYLYEQSRIINTQHRTQRQKVEQEEYASNLRLAEDILGDFLVE